MAKTKLQNSLAPIRVLHIVTIMDRCGLETMLMNYYRHIDRSKIQFDFIVHRAKKGAYDDEIIKMGGKIYRMPPISLKNIYSYRKKLRSLLISHPEYKIVHSHLDSLSALPLSIAKKANVPTRIAHSHTSNFDKNYKVIIRYTTKYFIKFYATDYFGCSKEAVTFMFGSSLSNYLIMHNAIDVNKFAYNPATRNKVRKDLKISKDTLAVGHVGRFNYPKNHDFLIDIFSELHKKNNNSVLLLVGEGPLMQSIVNKVHKLGLTDSVKFLGSRPNVNDLMQAMDVFVFPSKYEGLGMALVEAQISGLKCIASNEVMPAEVNITNNIYYVGLVNTSAKWANEIEPQANKISRIFNAKNSTKIANFDIEEQSLMMLNFYNEKIISGGTING